MDYFLGQVSCALAGGATEPEAFTLILRLMSNHFDRTDTGASYTKCHNFGVENGTPFCDFSREFRRVVSAATGAARVLAPGVEAVLEMVRMAVNEQYPRLMPTLYPGVAATVSRPLGTFDAMWVAYETLAKNRRLPSTAKLTFLCLFLRRVRGHPPRRGPDLPGLVAPRAGRLSSRLHG